MSFDSAVRSAMPENADAAATPATTESNDISNDTSTISTAVTGTDTPGTDAFGTDTPGTDTTGAEIAAGAAAGAADTAAPGVTFADLGLPEEIVRKLTQNGVVTPFPIQAATIPDALAGQDILGRGRTGSGKTLAFGMPLLTLLSGGRTERKHPRGVILTPTRELAMQVADALQPYGDVLGLKMKVVCGGTSMQNQIYALERGVDILVATPGRLRDLINRGAAVLDQVRIAVLDEADQMADMGFLPEVTEILDLIPAGGQRLLFSATLENEIDTLVKRYLVDPVTHEVDAAQGAVTTMTHHVLVVKPKDKAPVTAAIAARKGRTIIFVRTQMGADRVAEQLRETGVRADALHGGMTQGARTRTLEDFKGGHVNVLVATDVAARGIHVDGIDLVLNVDPAGDHKDYLHRSGRTARAGKSGTVVSLALPHQRKQIFRLMEDAGVDASRHVIGGAGVFDEDVALITGARSLTDVQADAAENAAAAAEREVAELTRQLERVQRRAAELREEADRLTARSARERGEDPQEAIAAKAAAAAVAAETAPQEPAFVPEPRREERDSHDRDRDRDRDRSHDRPSYDRRDDRRDDRREDRDRGSYDRGGYDRRDSRPSYGDRDRRPSYGDRDRRDSRPSFGDRDRDRRPSFGDRDRRDSRPSFGDRDRRDSRPSYNRDSSRDDRRPSYGDRDRDRRDPRPSHTRDDRPFNRDRRDSRPSYGDRDRRPSFGDRDRDRPTSAPSSPSASSSYERKPRWKRNG
jgi:superfamily II DNA/RNA helicase